MYRVCHVQCLPLIPPTPCRSSLPIPRCGSRACAPTIATSSTSGCVKQTHDNPDDLTLASTVFFPTKLLSPCGGGELTHRALSSNTTRLCPRSIRIVCSLAHS